MMLEAIADEQQRNTMYGVVAGNLLKSCLANGYVGRFKFSEQDLLAVGIIHHEVAPSLHGIKPEPALDTDQGARVFFLAYQVLDPVLPNPFFGGEHQVLFPQLIENEQLTAFFPEFRRISR